ncbi:MAG: hypothetical protein KDB27_17910 [Planctomycetales bacterium]|nr:hypothetical protein [Planctomycetales bacterium]
MPIDNERVQELFLRVLQQPEELQLQFLDTECGDNAELPKLRIFADSSVKVAGEMFGMSRTTAYRHWTCARAWLKDQMSNQRSYDAEDS